MNMVKRVCGLYNIASVHDLRGYVAHFCYRRFKSFDTLLKVVVEHKDYISATCILRMLGDSAAVFHLVYMEEDNDLRWLRHALYIIDGCEQNIKVLSNEEMNRGSMPDEDLEVLNKGLRYNVELRKRLMDEAQQIIDASPLKKRDADAFNKIVEDRNWKFKEFKSYKKTVSNQYQWRELYKMIGRSDDIDVLSFLSQYTHSLSMSNIVMEMNEENRDGVLTEALALINLLIDEAMHFFAPERLYIMEGLFVPEMREKIRACYDDEHRPTVEQWNEYIRNNMFWR